LLNCLRQAEQIARDLGDDRRSGRIASYLGNYHQVMGDYEAAVVHGQHALEIASRVEDLPTRVACGSYLSLAYQTLGDYRRGIELARATIALLSGGLDHERFGMALLPSVYTRTSLARCQAEVGEFAEAAVVAERAIELAEEVNHVYSLMFACLGLGLVRLRQGEAEGSVALLERSLALCRRSDSPAMTALVGGFLGSAYVDAGRARDAFAVLEEAAHQAAGAGLGDASLPRGVALLSAGEAQASLGHLDEAAESARLALDAFARMKARGYQAWAHRLQAAVAARAHPKRAVAVEELYLGALAIAQELGMRPLIGRCQLGLAELYALDGADERARVARTRALDEFRALGMTGLAIAAKSISS
jgi:tetratricopeptide (TPR) repeat protein